MTKVEALTPHTPIAADSSSLQQTQQRVTEAATVDTLEIPADERSCFQKIGDYLASIFMKIFCCFFSRGESEPIQPMQISSLPAELPSVHEPVVLSPPSPEPQAPCGQKDLLVEASELFEALLADKAMGSKDERVCSREARGLFVDTYVKLYAEICGFSCDDEVDTRAFILAHYCMQNVAFVTKFVDNLGLEKLLECFYEEEYQSSFVRTAVDGLKERAFDGLLEPLFSEYKDLMCLSLVSPIFTFKAPFVELLADWVNDLPQYEYDRFFSALFHFVKGTPAQCLHHAIDERSKGEDESSATFILSPGIGTPATPRFAFNHLKSQRSQNSGGSPLVRRPEPGRFSSGESSASTPDVPDENFESVELPAPKTPLPFSPIPKPEGELSSNS